MSIERRTEIALTSSIDTATAQMFRDAVPALRLCSDDKIFMIESIEISEAGDDLSLGALPNLVSLILVDPFVVHKSIAGLDKLERLEIRSSGGLISLPAEIGRLTSLRELWISCDALKYIPTKALSLDSLDQLHFCNYGRDIKHLLLRRLPSGCGIYFYWLTARVRFGEMFFPRWGKKMFVVRPDEPHAQVKVVRKKLDGYYQKVDATILGAAKGRVLIARSMWRARERMYRPGGGKGLSQRGGNGPESVLA